VCCSVVQNAVKPERSNEHCRFAWVWHLCCRALQCVAVCCSELQCVQCVTAWYSVMQCVAACSFTSLEPARGRETAYKKRRTDVCVPHTHLSRWHVSRETYTCNVSLSHTHIHTVSNAHVRERRGTRTNTHTPTHQNILFLAVSLPLSHTYTFSFSPTLSLSHAQTHIHTRTHTKIHAHTNTHTPATGSLRATSVCKSASLVKAPPAMYKRVMSHFDAKVHPLLRPHLSFINTSCQTRE